MYCIYKVHIVSLRLCLMVMSICSIWLCMQGTTALTEACAHSCCAKADDKVGMKLLLTVLADLSLR